jgi:hypothetical protein
VGKTMVWVLEGETLVEDGVRTRRLPLADLRTANLSREARGLTRRILQLDFGRGRLVRIPSLTFEQRLAPADQTPAFAAFARELLATASQAAPSARFETGRSRLTRLYFGAGAILLVGLVLTLLAAFVADAAALGVELAARLGFVLILMIAAWPWIGAFGVRPIDPHSIPRELLP